ncbi:MAG: TlpA family protein disulfide reductase [Sphingobacteriaceae bacterium]
MERSRKITVSQITTGIMLLLLLVLTFNPQAKALLMQGLMKIGLFQPSVKNINSLRSRKGLEVPDIAFRNQAGEQINLSALKGKVVFINFWATWCPPCIAEMPSIHSLQQKFDQNKQFVLLMVDVDNRLEQSTAFMKTRNFKLPVVSSVGSISEDFISNTIPTTLILNKSGQVVFRHEGAADYTNRDFINYVDSLISQ